MKRNFRFIFCLFLVVSMLTVISLPLVFSQEEEEATLAEEILGEIASVDLKSSAIVIKQLDESVTVYVDNSTSIEKNEEVIAITDLQAGDKVIVKYATDETGKNIAISIQVELK